MLFGTAAKVQSWTEVVTQTQFWSPIARACASLASRQVEEVGGGGGKSAGGGVVAGVMRAGRAALVGPGFYTTTAKRLVKPPSDSAARIRLQPQPPHAAYALHRTPYPTLYILCPTPGMQLAPAAATTSSIDKH